MFTANFKRPSVLILILIVAVLVLAPALVSAAVTTYSNNTPTPLLDAVGPGGCDGSTPRTVTSTLTVPDAQTINDVNVALNLSHIAVGDLTVQLSSPGGSTITLIDRVGRAGMGCGFLSNNINTTLDDESGGGPVENGNPPTGASYTPQEALSTFDGQDAAGVWTLWVIDSSYPYSGTLNSWSLIIDGTPIVVPPTPPPPASPNRVIDDDPDGDGLITAQDNCPLAFNPDQEDGWGSDMGDACDTEWYNRTGQGVSGFTQKNDVFHLHGNCLYMADGQPRCPVIAAFDPLTFDPAAMPLEIGSDDAGAWSVWIFHLHSQDGVDVYQVNTYSADPPQPDKLVDDRLEIHVHGGIWTWRQRGGDARYQGGWYGGDSE